MRIEGASALVTGGSSGLGLAAARALATAGARVVVADLAPPREHVEGVEHVAADVTDSATLQAAVDRASELGPLRVLVTCAGVAPAGRVVGRSGPLPLEDFTRAIAVNLTGTFDAIRLAAARMAETEPLGDGPSDERGAIVATASVAAFDGQLGQAAYAASKGGVAAMTLPIARELAAHRIRMVSIAPGVFDTPMMASFPDDVRASLGAQVPHPARLGDPAEFAALVRHVVENPYLNGETIRLDGGIRMGSR